MLLPTVAAPTGRVLVVEDDVDQGAMLGELLRLVAGEVFVTSSAEEAVAIHRRTPVDVVVADVNLEGMSGLDLLRELSAPGGQTLAPRVVLVTGSPAAHPGVEALELGATQYLQKPCDPDRLLRLVRDLLDARFAIPAQAAAAAAPEVGRNLRG